MIIEAAIKKYRVVFTDDPVRSLDEAAEAGQGRRRFVLIDRVVAGLYRHQLARLGAHAVLEIDATEHAKEYSALLPVYERLVVEGFTRNDVLVTVGGGILQDLSGFIASTLLRGLRWVFVPTTLLSQADSCIGSKTSINLGAFKNLLGTYYPPDLILIDSAFCRTLDDRDLRSGMGEILKFHLMADEQSFRALVSRLAQGWPPNPEVLDTLIARNLEIKHSYFRDDEFDRGRRNLCNFGHCFGHALESATRFAVPHGLAVVVGMSVANGVAAGRDVIRAEIRAEIDDALRPFYPSIDLRSVDAQDVVTYMRKDKKRTGAKLSMILCRTFGDLFQAGDVEDLEVVRAFQGVAVEAP